MNVFSSIGHFFKKVEVKVSSAFIYLFGKQAAENFATSAEALLKSAFGVIVADAVGLIEQSNPLAAPADKRQAAFAKITADVKTAGISVTSSIINLAIEIAVSALKGNFSA